MASAERPLRPAAAYPPRSQVLLCSRYYNQQQLHHADAHVCGHQHFSNRGGWLRAGVMGATDGLVSIAGLMMGVAGSVSDRKTLLVSGVAGELPRQ